MMQNLGGLEFLLAKVTSESYVTSSCMYDCMECNSSRNFCLKQDYDLDCSTDSQIKPRTTW